MEMEELIRMTESLISKPNEERFLIILENLARVTGCERACLIVRNNDGELVIREGYPTDGHGIGQIITEKTGKSFLTRMLEEVQSTVLVTHPEADERLAYMKDLVRCLGICSILFVPLFHRGVANGILVVDSTKAVKQKFSKCYKIIHLLANLAAASIEREREKQKYEEKMIKKEKLSALGENSARVAHSVRNGLTTIGGFSRRILRNLDKKCVGGNAHCGNLREYAEIITLSVENLEKTVSNVLAFSRSQKASLVPSNLNQFIVSETEKLMKSQNHNGTVLRLALNKRLDHIKVCFDRQLLSNCLGDLFRNAVEASAKSVFIRNTLNPKQGKIELSFANDGKIIDENIRGEIFEPFMTTKTDGTGLGLANVRAMIEAHNGEICVGNSGEVTEFKIFLPLKQ